MQNLLKFYDVKNDGFTLAEVLVTLGIIGVISAMTLPTLIKNHQRQVYVTQLHKVYNELSQIGESYINSKNAVDLFEAGVSSQDGLRSFISSSLKIAKSCGSTFTDCFADSYKNLKGASVTNLNSTAISCYALPSGASICLSDPTTSHLLLGSSFINIIVDINGKSGPNTLGRDLFIFGMSRSGAVASNYNPLMMICLFPDPVERQQCEEQNNWNDLQKCQNATGMGFGGDGAHCFKQIESDGFKMEY